MEIIPVRVHAGDASDLVRNTFIMMVSKLDLDGTEGTLKKYPGCIHWHLHKPNEPGTLEATWWPDKRRFWLSVHENRKAHWQEHAINYIKNIYEAAADVLDANPQ